MARVVRARHEKGVLRPLEKLDLREGEEVRIIVLPKDFSELIEEVEVEAKEDIDKVLREGRERWVEWYSTQA
uniref:Antitoxin n=1 Tax=Ignisphaera aggregans TaxID=334771 RepID=A0A7C2Z1B1_9CREN